MSKIICERVELKNFFSYGNNWTDIELLSGINAIIGHDEDKDRSNGSGKSTIISGIYFALFGKSLKDVSLDKMVNWKNGKQCEVRFHFTKDDTKYVIHRGIKPGILTLSKSGVDQPLLSDKRAFQQEIETELIGMDAKSAQMINFQNANSLVSMFTAKKEEKRKFIEKFFSLETYTKMNELVNKKLGVLTTSISDVISDITAKQIRVSELQNDLKNQTVCSVDEDELKLSNLNEQIGSIVVPDLKEVQQQYKDQQLLTTEVTVKRDEVKLKGDNLSKSINSLNLSLSHANKRVEQIGDISEQRLTVDKINEVLPRLKDLDRDIDRTNHEKKLIEKELSDNEYYIKQHNVGIKRLEKELNTWNNINTLSSVECPTCYQTVDPEHIISHIEDKKLVLSEEIQSEQLKIDDLIGHQEPIKVRLELATSTLETLTEKSKKKSKLEIKLATYSDLEQKELELVELNKEINHIQGDIDNSSQLMGEYIDELSTIEDKLKGYTSDENRLREQVKKIEIDELKLNNLKSEQANLVNFIEKQKEIIRKITIEREIKVASIEQLNTEIVQLEKGIIKKSTLKDYLTYIKETLKDDNTKQYAISNIVPYINSQTNHYLSETGHNYYVKLDNWLEGEILGAGVGSCDFNNMSAGEGTTIDLAIKFAMMDVARRQCGSYLDILVLDELLDSSIDSSGLDGMMNIIKLKQQEDNLKVYVISHREEIQEFGFDRVYQVTKKNAFSHISLL